MQWARRLITQIQEDGEQVYSYDLRGNLTEVSRGERLLKAFTFDAANRMCSAVQIRDGIEKRAEYHYNAFGNRVEQDIYSSGNPGSLPEAAPRKLHDPERQIYYVLYLTRQYHNLLMSEEDVEKKTNCYSYAFGMLVNPVTGKKFPQRGNQPGLLSNDEYYINLKKYLQGMQDYGYLEYQSHYSAGTTESDQNLVNVIKDDANVVGLNFKEYEERITGERE